MPGREWFRQLQGGQMNAAQSRWTGLHIGTGFTMAYSGRMVYAYQSVVSPFSKTPLTRTMRSWVLFVSMIAEDPCMYAR